MAVTVVEFVATVRVLDLGSVVAARVVDLDPALDLDLDLCVFEPW